MTNYAPDKDTVALAKKFKRRVLNIETKIHELYSEVNQHDGYSDNVYYEVMERLLIVATETSDHFQIISEGATLDE